MLVALIVFNHLHWTTRYCDRKETIFRDRVTNELGLGARNPLPSWTLVPKGRQSKATLAKHGKALAWSNIGFQGVAIESPGNPEAAAHSPA